MTLIARTGTRDFPGWSGSARIIRDGQGPCFGITLA